MGAVDRCPHPVLFGRACAEGARDIGDHLIADVYQHRGVLWPHVPLPSTRRANRSAASRWLPGSTCAYTVIVTTALACPSLWETTCTGSRSVSRIVA